MNDEEAIFTPVKFRKLQVSCSCKRTYFTMNRQDVYVWMGLILEVSSIFVRIFLYSCMFESCERSFIFVCGPFWPFRSMVVSSEKSCLKKVSK